MKVSKLALLASVPAVIGMSAALMYGTTDNAIAQPAGSGSAPAASGSMQKPPKLPASMVPGSKAPMASGSMAGHGSAMKPPMGSGSAMKPPMGSGSAMKPPMASGSAPKMDASGVYGGGKTPPASGAAGSGKPMKGPGMKPPASGSAS